MKLLTLIRHAKSSHDHVGLADIQRPLNTRGLNDTELMASQLQQQRFACDAVFCSPAVRARETATRLFQDTASSSKLQTRSELYTFDMETLYRFIELIEPDIEHAVIVAHNPAITLLANDLAFVDIDNVPTCGIVRFELAIEEWVGIAAGTGELLSFDYPKIHRTG